MAATIAPKFAGPWEVEEDVSYRDIDARKRSDTPSVRVRLQSNDRVTTDQLLEDAELLREHGYTFDRIASKLGMPESALEKRLRGKLRPQYSLADRLFLSAFERAVAAREPFTTDTLPRPDTQSLVNAVTLQAVRRGRIRKARGARTNTTRSRVNLWEPI